MITYDFACKNCELIYEVNQSIKDSLPIACAFCEESEGFEQIYSIPTFFVKAQPNNVGWQAEVNTKRMGKDEIEERVAKKREKVRAAKAEMAAKVGGKVIQDTGERAAWSKKIDTSKISNVREYVEGQ